ncbi:MAG: DUF2807 domain-containing protein [Bacteroidia bacterium]|nr:DUF2807 domain-containing protein [Bacteroidia bacterium]
MFFCAIIITTFSIKSIAQKEAEDSRKVDDLILKQFNQLEIKGNVIVYLSQNAESSITYEGNKSSVRSVKVQITDGILSIANKANSSKEKIKIYLTFQNLESIKTIGNVEIETTTNLFFNKLSLDLSEETVTTFFVNSTDLKLQVYGKGEVNLSGFIDTLRINTYDDCEVFSIIKSKKVFCRSTDQSSIKFKGNIFKLYTFALKSSYIEALSCEVGVSSIVAFDDADVKLTSLDATEIYAYDNSTIYYRSQYQATIQESSFHSFIKEELIKTAVNK